VLLQNYWEDKYQKTYDIARCWWLMPVSLATQEAEIKRIMVQSQTGQIVLKTLPRENPSQKGVAQGVGPEFKLQHSKKK
jgi:hypothetical protein